ncbi:glycosyltransferase family 4 protein [uncultured Roseibium sp.]|uniref:glycosyltransferase family 4 protein n=1 Tax=uncultured Roseibium sp. TaxID=1936171 RepID=UPI00260D8883|nr:glycosyltransferase family 4 protein [uncultured Roseibium sp.]
MSRNANRSNKPECGKVLLIVSNNFGQMGAARIAIYQANHEVNGDFFGRVFFATTTTTGDQADLSSLLSSLAVCLRGKSAREVVAEVQRAMTNKDQLIVHAQGEVADDFVQNMRSILDSTDPPPRYSIGFFATRHGGWEEEWGQHRKDSAERNKLVSRIKQIVDARSQIFYVAPKNIRMMKASEFGMSSSQIAQKFVLVSNGLPPIGRVETTLPNLGLRAGIFTFILIGRADTDHKGHLRAVQAVEALKTEHKLECQIILFGDGIYSDLAVNYAQSSSSIGHCVYNGGYSNNAAGHIHLADFLLLPSTAPDESTPGVLYEALQEGKPSIATDVGRVSEIMSGAGLLMKPEKDGTLRQDHLVNTMQNAIRSSSSQMKQYQILAKAAASTKVRPIANMCEEYRRYY